MQHKALAALLLLLLPLLHNCQAVVLSHLHASVLLHFPCFAIDPDLDSPRATAELESLLLPFLLILCLLAQLDIVDHIHRVRFGCFQHAKADPSSPGIAYQSRLRFSLMFVEAAALATLLQSADKHLGNPLPLRAC